MCPTSYKSIKFRTNAYYSLFGNVARGNCPPPNRTLQHSRQTPGSHHWAAQNNRSMFSFRRHASASLSSKVLTTTAANHEFNNRQPQQQITQTSLRKKPCTDSKARKVLAHFSQILRISCTTSVPFLSSISSVNVSKQCFQYASCKGHGPSSLIYCYLLLPSPSETASSRLEGFVRSLAT